MSANLQHNTSSGPASAVRSRAKAMLRACAEQDLARLLERAHGLGGRDWSKLRSEIRQCLNDLERT